MAAKGSQNQSRCAGYLDAINHSAGNNRDSEGIGVIRIGDSDCHRVIEVNDLPAGNAGLQIAKRGLMKNVEIAKRVSSYFRRLRVPGFGRFAVRDVYVKEQTASYTTVVASVNARVRFGPSYHAPVQKDVVLVVHNGALAVVESDHCWLETWDAYWRKTFPTLFGEAQAAVRRLFRCFDEKMRFTVPLHSF